MKKNLSFSLFLFLLLAVSHNVFALTISATASGDLVPGTATWTALSPSIVNGDFTITGNSLATLVGDGVDETTTWTFDFTSDANYSSFLTSEPLTSAWLELTLTPRNGLITTDAVRINGLPYITTTIQLLHVGETTTIGFDLLDYYTSAQVLGKFTAFVTGEIGMTYVDDAIVSYANLSLSNTPVPEPATLILFGAGLAGLAGFSRRKKK